MSRFLDELILRLKLEPLPTEGGLFRQTYISSAQMPREMFNGDYAGPRAISTSIYYLLTDEADSFSALHRLKSDEIYHFYLGDPVEMLLLNPAGTSQRVILGQNILGGHEVQWVVPRRVWQGSALLAGGKFALLGTTMSPGFHPDDFELGRRQELIQEFPTDKTLIQRLTRP